ncbi:hypothetical protein [Tepidiforma sp.]|uniref:hypothetical protein n=1 Tax=Tepidiforma sp. TaxID=2682230 RepID=UPI002ADE1B84|nr:hypothetical protein [Tepidiforma sp.]
MSPLRIWEMHSARLGGAIRTSPDGDAEVGGLLLSERAYLLAIRVMRPEELVRLVAEAGPGEAAQRLVELFAATDLDGTGRRLALGRSRLGEPRLVRSDEAGPVGAPPGGAG